MKSIFPLVLLWLAAGLPAHRCAADDAPLPPEIESLEILNVNKEPPHATLMPYDGLAQALAAKYLKPENDWTMAVVPKTAAGKR